MARLPPCDSRIVHPQQLGRLYCVHPQMQTQDQVVTAQMCGVCDLWKSPAPHYTREIPGITQNVLPPTSTNVLRDNATLPRPWEQYSFTVAIPHLDTPEILKLAIRCWQWQRPCPYILVIDTGSLLPSVDALFQSLRSTDGVEVATLGIHSAVEHLSDRVSIAMDYAFARCPHDYLLATHVDVFPKHRTVLEYLRSLCDSSCPVVGWEMSFRGEKGSSGSADLSLGIPGHACSMFHMPTMDRIGAGWSIRRAHHAFGLPRTKSDINGWPDTEVCLGRLLEQHGLFAKFLGRETNDENQETPDWIHARSSTVHANAGAGLLARHQSAIRQAVNRVRGWELDQDLSLDSKPPYLQTIGCQEELFCE